MKMIQCSKKLDSWNKNTFGNVQHQLNKARMRLKQMQEAYPTCVEIADNIFAREEVQMWLEREEIMWRQRSKALLPKEGGQNSKFFHSKASHRRKKNLIRKLENERGEWQEGDQKDRLVVEYFQSLFTESN